MSVILVADSGATKAEWCVMGKGKNKKIFTQGINPYFLSGVQIEEILRNELLQNLRGLKVDVVYYYGTGCSNPENVKSIKKALKSIFQKAEIHIDTDLMAAAKAVCGNDKGIVSILGTGSNSCFYNGKKIVKNRQGIGYILGDEASGAYLGKKVIQYYLYNTFDEDLRSRFDATYVTTPVEILDNVYKKPLPNRYMASFTMFLAENRGHYMIENILEDGINDFFFQHLCKYPEVWKFPVNFVGGVAHGFRDIILELCNAYEFELGTIVKNPIEGLTRYHSEK